MAQEATLYEAMYIVDVNLPDEEIAQVSQTLQEAVVTGGGEFVSDELFGRRRLAYSIEGHTEGIYRLLYFRGEGALVEELRHQFLLTEPIVRGIIVVANPKAVFQSEEKKAEEAAAALEAREPTPAPAAESEAPPPEQVEPESEAGPATETTLTEETADEAAPDEPAAQAAAD